MHFEQSWSLERHRLVKRVTSSLSSWCSVADRMGLAQAQGKCRPEGISVTFAGGPGVLVSTVGCGAQSSTRQTELDSNLNSFGKVMLRGSP